MRIYCGDKKIHRDLTTLLSDIVGAVEDNLSVHKKLFLPFLINEAGKCKESGLNIDPTITHHYKECNGAIFSTNKEAVYITGDTKAMPEIRNIIENIHCAYPKYKVFHDYSNWDCPEKQVHACASDVKEIYTEITRSRIAWYHNDEVFDNSWQEV